MQVSEMKSKLEEKIRALEEERNMLLEEVKQLREVVELNEKAKVLEDEVDKLRSEVKALKGRIPERIFDEVRESVCPVLEEDEEEDECSGCDEEELA